MTIGAIIEYLISKRDFNWIGKKDGGADRDRTGYPLLAKQVLYQVSYSPIKTFKLRWQLKFDFRADFLVL
jgi:hypothetical protein